MRIKKFKKEKEKKIGMKIKVKILWGLKLKGHIFIRTKDIFKSKFNI